MFAVDDGSNVIVSNEVCKKGLQIQAFSSPAIVIILNLRLDLKKILFKEIKWLLPWVTLDRLSTVLDNETPSLLSPYLSPLKPLPSYNL